MRRRAFIAAAGALGAPMVAGCGGGGGDDGGPTTADGTAQATDGGESAGQQAFPDYNWDRLAAADPVETSEITLSGFEFQPLIARVSVGTPVTFTNEDGAGHTVTIPALDVDAQLGGGEQTTVTVETVGTYDYVCALHPPDMLGRLIVE